MATMNYFRYDAWVKAANGPAIAGAQVYVLGQPSNLPNTPTPQVQVYEDVNGLVPLTQPVVSDGFGHVGFYVSEAGAPFTLAVYFNGILQNYYPDQFPMGLSANGGGGGGSSPESTYATSTSGLITFGVGINVLVLATAGTFGITLDLPDATTCNGQIIRIAQVDLGAGGINVVAVVGQTILSSSYGTSTNYGITNQGQCVSFEAAGGNWIVVATA